MKEENKKTEFKKCKFCNSEFLVNLRNKRSLSKNFCSSICAKSHTGINNKGKKRSVEYKEKLSENSKGVNNPFYGKSHSVKSLEKMAKSSMWDNTKFKNCNLNINEKEILDGLILSDGCLSEKSRISSRLTFGFKFKETCEEICKIMISMNFSPLWQSKKTKCWHTKSNMYHNLLEENKRWYINNEKHVPKDILITPLSCYWWFIGDGYNVDGNVYLCTDSFSEEDNVFLIKRLKEKGFTPSLTSKNRIRFNKKDSINFLNWIKPENGILKQYTYKWKI